MTATTRDPAGTGAEEGEITGDDLKESGSYQDHFRIIDELGQGGYGLVYVVSSIYNNNLYALKLQRQVFGPSTEQRDFKIEIAVMRKALRKPWRLQYLPRIVWKSRDQTRYAMEMLGPSISSMKEHLRKTRPEQPFTEVTVLRLAIHMLRCIRSLHEMGYIHRDIKPCNFLLTGDNENPVCLVDFGLCVKKAQCTKGTNIGTQQYMSLNAIYNEKQWCSDDVQSWFWSVLEMASDSDWKESKSENHLEFKQDRKKEALRRKLMADLQRLMDKRVKEKLDNAFKKEENEEDSRKEKTEGRSQRELLEEWMKTLEMDVKANLQNKLVPILKKIWENVKQPQDMKEELAKQFQDMEKEFAKQFQDMEKELAKRFQDMEKEFAKQFQDMKEELAKQLQRELKGPQKDSEVKMEREMMQDLDQELAGELDVGLKVKLKTELRELLRRKLKLKLRKELIPMLETKAREILLKAGVPMAKFLEKRDELEASLTKELEMSVKNVLETIEITNTHKGPQGANDDSRVSIFRRLLNWYRVWEDTDQPPYNEILGELDDELWRKHLCDGEPVYEWEVMDNSELSELTWVPLKNGKSRRFV